MTRPSGDQTGADAPPKVRRVRDPKTRSRSQISREFESAQQSIASCLSSGLKRNPKYFSAGAISRIDFPLGKVYGARKASEFAIEELSNAVHRDLVIVAMHSALF